MEEETQVKKPGFIWRHKKLLIAIIIFAGLAFGGNYYVSQGTKKETVVSTSIIDSLIEETDVGDGTGPIAKVNDAEISRVDYQNTVKELSLSLLQQGYTTTDSTVATQIRQQAISILVNTELLVQDAKAKGIVVTDAEVAAEYQSIIKDMGSEEVLQLTLKDMNLTEADLMEDIWNQLAVDSNVESNTTINEQVVTDAEVQTYYDNVSANNTDIPPLENIKDDLKEQLLQQKKQQVVSDFIQELRAKATIEILI